MRPRARKFGRWSELSPGLPAFLEQRKNAARELPLGRRASKVQKVQDPGFMRGLHFEEQLDWVCSFVFLSVDQRMMLRTLENELSIIVALSVRLIWVKTGRAS